MKPDILFRIMDDISADYISEAKPNYTRTRPVKYHSSAGTEDDAFAAARPVMQKRRKDNTMKGTVLQRLTTGMVAAASLAAFVGGGVFIAKQQSAKSQANSPAAQIAEIPSTNLLGGTGEITPLSGIHTAFFYDDSNFYSNGLRFSRSGALLTEVSPDNTLETFFWDGERFYERDGAKLSIVAQDGTRTPFLDVSAFDSNLDFTPESFEICSICHICDDIYLVEYCADGDNGILHAARSVLYHADTGTAEQFAGEPTFYTTKPDGANGFYCIVGPDLVHYTVTPELSGSTYHIGIGQEDAVIDTLKGYVISPDQRYAYFMAETQDNHDRQSYVRLDLESGDATVLFETAPLTHFEEADGKLYSLLPDKNELVSSDLDYAAHTVLWQPDDDTPQDFREQLTPDNWECGVLAANSEYVVMSFGVNRLGVFDLNTKTMRYIREVDAEAEPVQQTEEQQNET